MTPLQTHWLDELEDLIRSISDDHGVPLCFLIGAGASLSSEAPSTADVVSELMQRRPGMFPNEEAVYSRIHQLSADERSVIDRLFDRVVPHVGYRCLAAMARSRPIIVVNLNWDDCAIEACRRLGLPEDWAAAVNIQDTVEAEGKFNELRDRGTGLLSVHVHGRIRDPGERGLLFGAKETLSFKEREFELLQRLLNLRTFVVGTSLAGPHDVTQLVDALRPPAGRPDSDIKRLWVVERGPAAQVPNPWTDAGHNLTRALIDRYSTSNFIAAPDVDFDMFMVALRAAEVGFPWEEVRRKAPTDALLPARDQLVPPSPNVVRPLLDRSGLLVGRFEIGKWAVAHQVAHWLSILEERPRGVVSVSGGEAIANVLAEIGTKLQRPVVGDNCFGRDAYHRCPELVDELTRLGQAPGVILTSRPSPWFEALKETPALAVDGPLTIPFRASEVWEERSLRAYGRRRSPHGAADVVEAIGRGELPTPLHVDQAIEDRQVISHGADELTQLTHYLKCLRGGAEIQALAMALIRLQDMAYAVPRRQLEELCEQLTDGEAVDLSGLVRDPWELITSFRMDHEFLRIARREAVTALDQWMDEDRAWLEEKIVSLGERARWARDALARWEQFRDFDPRDDLSRFDSATVELLGPELIEPALGVSPKDAMRVLQAMFDTAKDSWAVREAAFELVRRWDSLRLCPKAHDLRDAFIADKKRRGMYALFEAMLRNGGMAPVDLWTPVVNVLIAMSRRLDKSNRRQVALCFDALLWREAPTDEQQDRMLLALLLEAAEKDKLLGAALATAAAYHWDGARRLADHELANPLDRLGNVTKAQAREMAWLIEWHLVHQSRNRALASRRYFRSTRSVPLSPDQSRLLSRKPLEQKLSKDAANGVIKVVNELARFDQTAGWALHMVLNVRSTFGYFEVPNLGRIVARIQPGDPGLIWAAVTYEPDTVLIRQMRAAMRNDLSREELQKALSGRLKLDRTSIVAPRFVTTFDPWRETRTRWQLNSALFNDLGLPSNEPWLLAEIAREVRDDAIAAGADRGTLDEVIDEIAAADTRLIDLVHSDDEFGVKGASDDIRRGICSLLVLASQIRAAE